jgi:hypothetical protein
MRLHSESPSDYAAPTVSKVMRRCCSGSAILQVRDVADLSQRSLCDDSRPSVNSFRNYTIYGDFSTHLEDFKHTDDEEKYFIDCNEVSFDSFS